MSQDLSAQFPASAYTVRGDRPAELASRAWTRGFSVRISGHICAGMVLALGWSVDTWLTVVATACAALGLAVGRWPVVLAPLIGWPVFYLGLAAGWWLYGVGDGWQYVALLTTVVGTVGAAVGVAIRRVLPSQAPTRNLSR